MTKRKYDGFGRRSGLPAEGRRHRILLDITFKNSCTYAQAVELFVLAINGLDQTDVQIVRPLDTKKVFEATSRMLDREIRLELETAMDALREARNKL